MIVLIDTNVLIDALTLRKPFEKEAKKILKQCYEKKINGFATAHSFTNMFYILRKLYSLEDMKALLLNLSKIVTIIRIDEALIVNSLQNSLFTDIEDCLQAECAKIVNADYIITRNLADFSESKIPAILPERFLSELQ